MIVISMVWKFIRHPHVRPAGGIPFDHYGDTTRPFSSARARYHASTAPPSEVTSIHHKALRQPSNRNFHHHSKTEDFSCPVLPNIAQVCWTLWCSRLEVLLELHGYGRKLCVSEGLREHTCKLPGNGSAILVKNWPLSFTPANGICCNPLYWHKPRLLLRHV